VDADKAFVAVICLGGPVRADVGLQPIIQPFAKGDLLGLGLKLAGGVEPLEVLDLLDRLVPRAGIYTLTDGIPVGVISGEDAGFPSAILPLCDGISVGAASSIWHLLIDGRTDGRDAQIP